MAKRNWTLSDKAELITQTNRPDRIHVNLPDHVTHVIVVANSGGWKPIIYCKKSEIYNDKIITALRKNRFYGSISLAVIPVKPDQIVDIAYFE